MTIDEVVFTPPKAEKKVRPPNAPKLASSLAPAQPAITPMDVTAAITLAAAEMPPTEAVPFIVQHWDNILKTTYPWPLVWNLLSELGWCLLETRGYTVTAEVIVAPWAFEKYESLGRNPETLVRNREFFEDQDDVRGYILKHGVLATEAPPSPVGRRRERPTATSNPMEDERYLKSLDVILQRKAAAASEVSLKRKIDLSTETCKTYYL